MKLERMELICYILFILILFQFLGYSQFETKSFEEMADEKYWAKTITVEGYVYLVKDFCPVMVKDKVKKLMYNKVSQDSYIMLDFKHIKYMPLGRGIFKARIKGIVNLRDCEYNIIGLDVIDYGLATQEKKYKRE